MNTVSAQTILDEAAHAIGWDTAQLEDRQEVLRREALSLALQEVWEAWWWEELMKCAQVNAATVYSATTLTVVDTFYYYPATEKFYQCLAATTGQNPATLNPDGITYTTNYAYWAEARPNLCAPDYTASNTYTAGNQVRNPADGLFYQCLVPAGQTLVQISGEGTAAANGTYLPTLASQTFVNAAHPEYTLVYASVDNGWDLLFNTTPLDLFGDTSNAAPSVPLTSPTGATLTAGTLPAPGPNLAWRALIPFTPELSVAGTVRSVSRFDPRNTIACHPNVFEQTATGWRLPGWHHGVPWVWSRRPTPILTGDAFDATITYTAALADNLVFDT